MLVINNCFFFNQTWYNEFRVWQDVFPYNCIEETLVRHGEKHRTWLPDAILLNSDSPYGIFRMEEEPVRIQSSGKSDFFPGGIIEAHCRFDLSFFPFDIQNCSFRVESWRLNSEQQIFTQFNRRQMQLANLPNNEQWEVINHGFQIDDVAYLAGTYSRAIFYLILKRKAGFYFITVIIPSTLISAAETATFLLPVYSETRLDLSFTCLLSYSVFQILVAGDMPRSAKNPPMISIFIAVISCFIFLACACQSLILIMADKSTKGSNLPSIMPGKLVKKLEQVACGQTWNKNRQRARNAIIWAYLTTTVNRIASVFYIFVIFMTPLICFVIIPRMTF